MQEIFYALKNRFCSQTEVNQLIVSTCYGGESHLRAIIPLMLVSRVAAIAKLAKMERHGIIFSAGCQVIGEHPI